MNKRKMVAAVLSVVTALSFLRAGIYADLTGTQNIGVIYSYGGDHPDIYLQGGWIKPANNSVFSFYYTEADRQIMYCIEPGITRGTGGTATRQAENYIRDSLSSRFLNGQQINDYINLILHFGYNGSVDGCMTALGDFTASEHKIRTDGAGLGTQAAKATQILIWETIVGERDADFNYVAPDEGFSPVKSVATSDGDVGEMLDLYYNRLVSMVRSHRYMPSFLSRNDGNYMEFEIGDDGTVTMTNTREGVTLSDWLYELVNIDGTVIGSSDLFTIEGNTVSFTFPDDLDPGETFIRGTDLSSGQEAVAWSSDGFWHDGSSTQDLVNRTVTSMRQGFAGFMSSASVKFTKSISGSVDSLSGVNVELWMYGSGRSSGYRNTSDTLIGTKSIASGACVFDNLSAGTYGVAEYAPRRYYTTSDGNMIMYSRNTPAGWSSGGYSSTSDSDIYYRAFDIASDDYGDVVTYSFANSLQYGSVDVTKSVPQADGFDITATEFLLYYDVDGNGSSSDADYLVSSGTVSSNGTVTWDRSVTVLPYGDYVIAEKWPEETITYADGTVAVVDTVNINGWAEVDVDGSKEYETRFSISSSSRNISFDVVNDMMTGQLSVIKNIDTEGDVSELEFSLYNGSSVVATGSASTDGVPGSAQTVLWEYNGSEVSVMDLPAGSYTIRETVPQTFYEDTQIAYTYDIPDGWTLSDDGDYFLFDVDVGNDGIETVRVSFTNTRLEGVLNINKVSETGIITGLNFNVWYRGSENAPSSDRILIASCVTGDDGTASVEKLPYGWYEVEEVVPDYTNVRWVGGALANGNKLIKIDGSQSVASVTAINTVSADIRVNKTDTVTGEAVGGTAFNLYRDTDGDGTLSEEESSVFTRVQDTDGDGVIVFKNIGLGQYIIREALTVDGYYLNDNDYIVNISDASEYVEDIGNAPYSAGVTIYKTDLDDNMHYLSGAEFELQDAEGNVLPVSITETRDLNGRPYYVTSEDLHFGDYILVETQAPQGFAFVTGQNEIRFSIDRKDTTADDFEIENIELNITNVCRGDIHITKIDDAYPQIRLSGAEFTVYKDVNENGVLDVSADTVAGIMTEEEQGEYYIRSLPYGHYLVKETSSPDNYLLSDQIWSVFINSNGRVYDVCDAGFEGVGNTLTGSIHIYKVDRDHPESALSGAVFTVYDEDGSAVGTMIEETRGNYYLRDLPYGEYSIEETSAPENYIRSEQIWTVSIAAAGMTYHITDGELDFDCLTNNIQRGSLKIIKTSYNDQVEGFTFRITGDGYDCVFDTDSSGVILINDLPVGDYTIHEVPGEKTRGYVLPADVTVTVEYDTVKEVGMYNDRVPSVPGTGETLVTACKAAGVAALVIGAVILIRMRKREK